MAITTINLDDVDKQYLRAFINDTNSLLNEYNTNKGSATQITPIQTTATTITELINENGNTPNYDNFPILKGIVDSLPSSVFVLNLAIMEIDASIEENTQHIEDYTVIDNWIRYHIPLKVNNNIITNVINGESFDMNVGSVYNYLSPNFLNSDKSLGTGTSSDNKIAVVIDVLETGEPSDSIKSEINDVYSEIRTVWVP